MRDFCRRPRQTANQNEAPTQQEEWLKYSDSLLKQQQKIFIIFIYFTFMLPGRLIEIESNFYERGPAKVAAADSPNKQQHK